VIRRDHGVEFTAHRAHENCVSRERTVNSCRAGSGSEELDVLAAEPPTVAQMRVETAKRQPRLLDSEPAAQPLTGDRGHLDDCRRSQFLADVAQSDVGRSQHHPKLVGCKHHRHARVREMGQHFRVSGVVVAAGVER